MIDILMLKFILKNNSTIFMVINQKADIKVCKLLLPNNISFCWFNGIDNIENFLNAYASVKHLLYNLLVNYH